MSTPDRDIVANAPAPGQHLLGAQPDARPLALRSAKIQDRHREPPGRRLRAPIHAHSRYSNTANRGERQYALADHAAALGWPSERVVSHRRGPGPQRQERRGAQRLPPPARRGYYGPRRPGARPGDEPAGALQQGLAPPAGGLRRLRRPAGRPGRRLRLPRRQRPAPARVKRDNERI